mgnify:CR=1 FL=1
MFELTIYEYEDTQVIGTYETRDAALIALGQWFLDHGDAQLVYPRITEV